MLFFKNQVTCNLLLPLITKLFLHCSYLDIFFLCRCCSVPDLPLNETSKFPMSKVVEHKSTPTCNAMAVNQWWLDVWFAVQTCKTNCHLDQIFFLQIKYPKQIQTDRSIDIFLINWQIVPQIRLINRQVQLRAAKSCCGNVALPLAASRFHQPDSPPANCPRKLYLFLSILMLLMEREWKRCNFLEMY